MSAENLKALVEKGNLINLNIVSDSLANLLNEVATMLVDQQKQINQLKKELVDRCLQAEIDSFKEQYRADKGTIMRSFPTIDSKFSQVNSDLQTTKEELKKYIDNSLANTLLGIDNRIFQRTETILNEQHLISSNISSLDLKVQDLTAKQLESNEKVQEYATLEDMNKVQKRIQKTDEQIVALAQKQKEICIATNTIAGQVKTISRRQIENSQLQYNLTNNSNQPKENQTNTNKQQELSIASSKNASQQSINTDSSQTSNQSLINADSKQEQKDLIQNSDSIQAQSNSNNESANDFSNKEQDSNSNIEQENGDSNKEQDNSNSNLEQTNVDSNKEQDSNSNMEQDNVDSNQEQTNDNLTQEQNDSIKTESNEESNQPNQNSNQETENSENQTEPNVEERKIEIDTSKEQHQSETSSMTSFQSAENANHKSDELQQSNENLTQLDTTSLDQRSEKSLLNNSKVVSMHIEQAPFQKSEPLINTQSEDVESDFLSDFTFNKGIDEKIFESFKSEINQQINQIEQQIKHIYSETETIKDIQANQQKNQDEPNRNEQIIFGELDQIKAEIVQIEDVIEEQNKELVSRIERKSEISLVERMFEKLRLLIASVRDDITAVKKRIEVFVEKREMEEYVQGIIRNLLEEEHASFTNKPVKCLACGRARLNPSQLELQTLPSANSKDRSSELPALKFTIPRV